MDSLFHLKTTVEPSDSVWDIVTCAETRQDRFLCGPSQPTLDLLTTLCQTWGEPVLIQGRMDANSYRLPFPTCYAVGGKPLGSFIKMYTGEGQVKRAKKEFDAMQYLGLQPETFPLMITHRNFPTPCLLLDRVLLLPLVLTTKQLRRFCCHKIAFYQHTFQLTIDVSFAMPLARYPRITCPRQKILHHLQLFSMTTFLRQQLAAYAFTHGDMVDANVILEDGRNLMHRLTGQWPDPHLITGIRCLHSTPLSFVVHAYEWPVLVDYDTVSFPSDNYFQNMEDYFCETPFILQSYQTFDRIEAYTHWVSRTLIPLLQSTTVKKVTHERRRCCVAYFKAHDMRDPFRERDDLHPVLSSSSLSYHALHSTQTPLSEEERTQLSTYLDTMSSVMFSMLKLFNDTLEDPQLTLTLMISRLQTLQQILHCTPMVYSHDAILEVTIKDHA